MIYKFEKPLKIPNMDGFETIKELNIDMDKLTIKDIADIETGYYKNATDINIPDLSKKMSVRWFTKMIELFLKKQYPNLGITENDVNKISWIDAHRILMYLESQYIALLGDIVQSQYEQLMLAKEYENDTVSEKAD